MSSILTYTEKQYKKTIKQEAFEDGYESRQPEIDELNEVINEKDAEIEKLTYLLLNNGIDVKKYN